MDRCTTSNRPVVIANCLQTHQAPHLHQQPTSQVVRHGPARKVAFQFQADFDFHIIPESSQYTLTPFDERSLPGHAICIYKDCHVAPRSQVDAGHGTFEALGVSHQARASASVSCAFNIPMRIDGLENKPAIMNGSASSTVRRSSGLFALVEEPSTSVILAAIALLGVYQNKNGTH